MVTEGEESPSICFGKALAIFHGYVDAVVCTIEVTSAGRFGSGTIGKGGTQNKREFLDDDSSLREHTVLQISVHILRLDIDVVIFREAGFSAIKCIRRKRRADEDPTPKACG